MAVVVVDVLFLALPIPIVANVLVVLTVLCLLLWFLFFLCVLAVVKFFCLMWLFDLGCFFCFNLRLLLRLIVFCSLSLSRSWSIFLNCFFWGLLLCLGRLGRILGCVLFIAWDNKNRGALYTRRVMNWRVQKRGGQRNAHGKLRCKTNCPFIELRLLQTRTPKPGKHYKVWDLGGRRRSTEMALVGKILKVTILALV